MKLTKVDELFAEQLVSFSYKLGNHSCDQNHVPIIPVLLLRCSGWFCILDIDYRMKTWLSLWRKISNIFKFDDQLMGESLRYSTNSVMCSFEFNIVFSLHDLNHSLIFSRIEDLINANWALQKFKISFKIPQILRYWC